MSNPFDTLPRGGFLPLCLALVGAMVITCPARADPCTAPITGYHAGQTFTGQVRYVGDGDSICIGQAANPATWIEVRLVDYFAPELNEPGGREAKRKMDSLACGRPAVCTVRRGHNGRTSSYDRVIASCSINGVHVGELMRRAGVIEGGRGH